MSSRHQAVLAIFFEEGVTTLSPAHLAYRMGVPVREAEALLDEMVTDDLLSLDFSGDHDFGYRLPPGTLPPTPERAPNYESHSYDWQAHGPAHHQDAWHAAPAQASPSWQHGSHVPPSYGGAPGHSASGYYAADYGSVDYRSAQNHAPPPQRAATAPDGTDGTLGPLNSAHTAFAEPSPSNPWQTSPRQPNAFRPAVRSTELVPLQDNLPRRHTETDRKPFVAGLLSFLVTGLGQVYNGEPLKGGLMFATSMMMWLFMMGWVISMWSIADAYVVAQRAETQGT